MINEKTLTEFFKISPTPSLVLLPDAPKFTIIEANAVYLEVTNFKREDLVGKGIFEAFLENVEDHTSEGMKHLTTSLTTVVQTKKSHKMAVQKHNIPIRGTTKFQVKYWKPENIPLIGESGEVQLIVHTVVDVTENVLSTKKIEESSLISAKGNEILQQIENLSKLGRWELDLVTKKIYWSDIHYVMLGYQPQEFEMTYDKVIEFIHPDDRERIITQLEDIQKERKDYKLEFRFKTKSDAFIHVLTRGTFIFDDQGKLQKLVGVLQDITDTKQAEQEAKRTQTELQKILDMSLDIICSFDGEGRFLKVNAASTKIWGYTPEELIGERYSKFIYRDGAYQKTKEVEIRAYSGIEINSFENTYVRKDGTLVPMIWSARWQESENTMYCVGKDATDFKKAEKHALETQAFVEAALENLPIGIALNKIKDEKVIWMNKKFTEIYGWPEEILIDIPTFFEKVYPDEAYRNEIMGQIINDIKTGNKDQMKWEDITITTQKGEQKEINAKNIPLYDQNLMISTVVDVTEKMKARKALVESNERFEYVTKATFDAIWDWNLETNAVYWGEGFEKIFGHNITSLSTDISSWKDYIHPDDAFRVLENIYACIGGTETNWKDEYRYKKANGDFAFVVDKGIVVRNHKGKAVRMIGTMQDVSKQKKEESRLKLFESVITNATDAVIITEAEPFDQPGPKILFVNEAFTKMTGYSAEEVIGKTPRILQGPDSDKEEIKKLSLALRNWESYETTLLNYKKTGEEFWINMVLNPVADEKGGFTHWIAIERDVTEKIKQEQELATINQKLSNTLESIQDGFYTLDAHWNVSYWNHEVERISGKSQQEMMGKNMWEVFEGQISKTMYTKFHEAKEQNVPIRLEMQSKTQNKWFELNAFPSALGLTVYFKDISVRKQTEWKIKKMNKALEVHIKQLAISNEELEQFAYIASHDLQEPLRMITGFLTQIEKKYEHLLDEKGKKYIFFAVDGAKRMRQIILDLLQFSRIGKNELKIEEINLNEVVDEVVLLFGKQIKEKNAQINYQNLPKIKAFLAPIKQIFQNLIGNSLKYSKVDQSPIITITSEETSYVWKFIIQDNGIGINAEYFEKIFIIFQRLHNKDEYSGTGIGLAITKKIVENLGGQIWVESQEGIGSAFHFTIPKKQTKKP